MSAKTLSNFTVSGAFYQLDRCHEIQTGDVVRLFLDQTRNEAFPESLLATVTGSVKQVNVVVSGCVTEGRAYNFTYETDDLAGAADHLDVCDITDVSGVSCCDAIRDGTVPAGVALKLRDADGNDLTPLEFATELVTDPENPVAVALDGKADSPHTHTTNEVLIPAYKNGALAEADGVLEGSLYRKLDGSVLWRQADETPEAALYLLDAGKVSYTNGSADSVWAVSGGTGTGTSTGDGTECTLSVTSAGLYVSFLNELPSAVDISDGGIAIEIEPDANMNAVLAVVLSGAKAAIATAYPTEFLGGRQFLVIPLSSFNQAFFGWTSADAAAVDGIRLDVYPNSGQTTVLKVRKLYYYKSDGVGRVNFFFDDGRLDTYTVARPILSANGYAGDIGVALDYIGTANHMTEAQIAEVYGDGWGICGHHGVQMTTLSEPEQRIVHTNLKAWMDANGYDRGKSVWAWPGGVRTAATDAIAADYWKMRRPIVSITQYGISAPRLFAPTQPAFRYISTATALSTLKDIATAVAANGGTANYVFHSIATAPDNVDSVYYDTAQFTELVEHCASLGLRDVRAEKMFSENLLE